MTGYSQICWGTNIMNAHSNPGGNDVFVGSLEQQWRDPGLEYLYGRPGIDSAAGLAADTGGIIYVTRDTAMLHGVRRLTPTSGNDVS